MLNENFLKIYTSVKYINNKWNKDIKLCTYSDGINLPPSATVLHYAQTVFEGIKGKVLKDNKISILNIEKHITRFNRSCERIAIPRIGSELFLNALQIFLKTNRDQLISSSIQYLYIRPVIFGIENSLYVRPSNQYLFLIIGYLLDTDIDVKKRSVEVSDSKYIRAFKGGTGDVKYGGNYAPTFLHFRSTNDKNIDEVLWVRDSYIEEATSMNIFFIYLSDGNIFVKTPSIHELTILNGITRRMVISLLKSWKIDIKELKLNINDIVDDIENNKIIDIFLTGTLASIKYVNKIYYASKEYIINNGSKVDLVERLFNQLDNLYCNDPTTGLNDIKNNLFDI